MEKARSGCLSTVEKWWLMKYQIDFEKNRLSMIDGRKRDNDGKGGKD
jgi:hypothetical protein